jgi:hypothetical protein
VRISTTSKNKNVQLCSITDDFLFSRLDNGQLSSLDLPTRPFRIDRLVHRSSKHLFLVDSAQLFALSLADRFVRRLLNAFLCRGPSLSTKPFGHAQMIDNEAGSECKVLGRESVGRCSRGEHIAQEWNGPCHTSHPIINQSIDRADCCFESTLVFGKRTRAIHRCLFEQ